MSVKNFIGYCLRMLTFLICEPVFRLAGRRDGRYDQQAVTRLLVVRLDEIGDMVLTTPFLRELRRLFPNARITLVVKPAVVNLVALCPYVDEVLAFDPGIRRRFGHLRRHVRACFFARRHLWGQRFDLAVIPRWDADYYYAVPLAYLSGARWRIGCSERVSPEKERHDRGADWLLTCAVLERDPCHEVERNLALLRYLGGTAHANHAELWLDDDDQTFAEALLREHGWHPGRLLIAVGPAGGSSVLKQWPLERFIEMIGWLQEQYQAQIVLVGGPGEEELGVRITEGLLPPIINAIGKTTLRQMAAILARAQLYLGNDSGPMHIAAAMGIPVIALFGPSCSHRFGPWTAQATVLQQMLPCHPCAQGEYTFLCPACTRSTPDCLYGITITQVQSAVTAVLARQQTAGMPAAGTEAR